VPLVDCRDPVALDARDEQDNQNALASFAEGLSTRCSLGTPSCHVAINIDRRLRWTQAAEVYRRGRCAECVRTGVN
jgi:hypothetical protein